MNRVEWLFAKLRADLLNQQKWVIALDFSQGEPLRSREGGSQIQVFGERRRTDMFEGDKTGSGVGETQLGPCPGQLDFQRRFGTELTGNEDESGCGAHGGDDSERTAVAYPGEMQAGELRRSGLWERLGVQPYYSTT